MTADQAARLPFPLAPVTVVTGHYGVGKTNFALNLALDAAAAGYRVTLADMDVVNPYFRSNEYRDLLEEAGVRLIAPVFGHAGTSLDVPSVTGELAVAAAEAYRDETGRTVVIVDAGGDDVGATALARFAPALAAGPYAMLYVVNAFRNLTQEPPPMRWRCCARSRPRAIWRPRPWWATPTCRARLLWDTSSKVSRIPRQWPRWRAFPLPALPPPFRPFSGKTRGHAPWTTFPMAML